MYIYKKIYYIYLKKCTSIYLKHCIPKLLCKGIVFEIYRDTLFFRVLVVYRSGVLVVHSLSI
jgi:hypothetical protein